jgi:hypothetical protein
MHSVAILHHETLIVRIKLSVTCANGSAIPN